MEIDQESRRAFGAGISVDRYAGSVITLRLGERPTFEHIDGSPTRSYLSALRRLPKLETQGDGVRSYLGLILNLTAGSHQILLIDEPEAFLHPPRRHACSDLSYQKKASRSRYSQRHTVQISCKVSLKVGRPFGSSGSPGMASSIMLRYWMIAPSKTCGQTPYCAIRTSWTDCSTTP